MDSHSSLCILTDVQESTNDDVIGRAAIYEEEVVVVEAGVGESPAIIDLFVQADDGGHIVLPEVWEVSLRSVQWVTCGG